MSPDDHTQPVPAPPRPTETARARRAAPLYTELLTLLMSLNARRPPTERSCCRKRAAGPDRPAANRSVRPQLASPGSATRRSIECEYLVLSVGV